MQILSLIQSIARIAYKIRVFIWALAAASLIGFFYVILKSEASLDTYLMPMVVLFGWSICLLGIGGSFREVPELPDKSIGFFQRIAMRFRYRIAWFWALFFLICTLILLYMSIRSVFIVLGG